MRMECDNDGGADSSSPQHKKRKFLPDVSHSSSDYMRLNGSSIPSRQFLRVPHCEGVYQSTVIKPNLQDIHFTPLTAETWVNVTRYEQITFQAGVYCLGDAQGLFTGTTEGKVIILWRLSETCKLLMATVLLFTNAEAYKNVLIQLEYF